MTPMACSADKSSIGGAAPRADTANSGGQGDQRDRRQVLEQQHGEGQPAVAQRQLALLLQHLQREGGRGQRQRQAGEHGGRPGQAERHGDGGQHQRGDRHLGAAQAEDGGAHGPQALGAQLQADQEQQQHHAELGEMQDRVHLVDRVDEAQPERADQHADQQIAQHVADAQELGQRRRHHGGGQEQAQPASVSRRSSASARKVGGQGDRRAGGLKQPLKKRGRCGLWGPARAVDGGPQRPRAPAALTRST